MVTAIVVRITKKRNDFDNEDDKNYDAKDHDNDEMIICSGKAADGGFCDGHSSHHDKSPRCKPSDDVIDERSAVDISRHDTNNSKKRPLHFVKDKNNDTETKKRGKKRPKFIDLTDVPPQSPILNSSSKDGTSKYEGVFFNKASNKWKAQISFDGKQHYIGYYDNEEEAAIDYARAVSKYRAGITRCNRKQIIDLNDVPLQSPILKSRSKDGASKYEGVYFNKAANKWVAQISFDGKPHHLGVYDNEEEAAIDYARAVSKYKGGKKGKPKFIDLTDVPPQNPLLKSSSREGTSKYKGVYFNKAANKWQAQIYFDGKRHSIGCYDNEEEAAIDYARAVSKYTTATRNEEEPPSSSSSSTSNNTKKKKYRKPQCSHPSCPNRVMNRGVCARHGARVRTCSIVDCTKYAQKGGLCIRHGAVKEYKRCVVGGCKSRPVGKEEVCASHAGIGDDDVVVDSQDEERQDVIMTMVNVVDDEQQPARDHPDEEDHHQDEVVAPPTPITTTTAAAIANKCIRLMSDGAPPRKSSSSKNRKCSMSQCTKQAKVGGLCMKHGGKVKYRFCNASECSNITQKGGYCKRHYNEFGGGSAPASSSGGGYGLSSKKRKLSDASEGGDSSGWQ